MILNREQQEILIHTACRAAGGYYCGDSRYYCGDSQDMQVLVAAGLMESAGRKSFVPDEYFRLTPKGCDWLRDASEVKGGRYDK